MLAGLGVPKKLPHPNDSQRFSAIFSAIFWRFSAISAPKLAICTLRFESASDFSAITIFGGHMLEGVQS